MKRRRKSVDQDEQEDRIRKKKEPRIDRWLVPSFLEKKLELCERLHEVLKGLKNEEGQSLTEFLLRTPSRRFVPDYYQLIERPIDLMRMQQKLKTGSYNGASSYIADVQLLLSNARSFYKSSSIEYKNIKVIEEHFLSTLSLYIESEDSVSPMSPKTVSLKLSNLPSNVPATSLSKSTPSVSKATPTITPKSSSTPAVKSIKIKTTRSKAWLDSYLNSNDPIKIYFANIYSYHDINGEYVAQPFLEMPSRKEYPEYYQVIVEPIDLATIKGNIDSQRYVNLKAIQDDMLLLIKNAHHFNEPGSLIYKMATTLRRYVINRCIELERHYRTVQVTTQKKSPPPESGGKSIKSPPCQGRHTSKIRNSSTEAGDDSESGDELTATESEDEGGASTKKRLLLKVKKEKLFGKETNYIEKVLKAKTQPKLKKLLHALYRTLVNAESDDERVLSEMFMKRPSPKLYPEYYIVIANPIDFREISKKIREEKYQCQDEFMDDISLLVNNACAFNEENSQIHMDALQLQKIAHSSHDQIKKRWSTPVSVTIATSNQDDIDKPTVVNSIKVLYLSIVNALDMTGRNLWHTFKDPPIASESSEGVTYKKCVGMTTISQRIKKGEYNSLDQLSSDLCVLFNAYCETNPSNSQPYKDAVMLHRISVTKYNDLSRDSYHSYRPNAQEEVKKLLKEIMKRTMQYKDDSGFVLCNGLKDVVVTQESHDKEDDAKSRRVFSMEKISIWVNTGRYIRLDQLQADVVQVLRKAREVKGQGSNYNKKLYELSKTLEKGFIQIRDKICGNGAILWSPALKRTVKDVDEEEIEKHEQEDSDIEDMETSDQKQQLLEPIVPYDKRTYHDQLIIKGVAYEKGEFVYVQSKEPHLPSQISLIESLWTDDSGNEWFDGCWFPHPHETYHIASRKFYEKEVFKSDFICSNRFTRVVGKCCVLFMKDYVKYQAEEISDDDVYICESRYSLKQRQMKKIKVWNLQYKPKLVPRVGTVSLTRIPSVFAMDESIKSDRESLEPVMEQESVSEQIDPEARTASNESLEGNKDSTCSSHEESDIIEMSFFEDLKEVPATVPNPEENHTYYEQFCIDDKVFKLGDYVCVRSDQEHPYVARIDKMWTDNNGDPWFHGPWFVRMEEIVHLPTRMFYECELFLSSIHDTNPMRSIMRKCAVLGPADYMKLRPTEVLEEDVFVCECRYNEADKSIKKHKGLKVFQLNENVLLNEIYYLQEELKIRKCHSHNLINQPIQAPPTTSKATSASASKQNSVSNSVSSKSATPTPKEPPTANPVVTVPLTSGQLTLTLPQLQALIATQLTASKSGSPSATPSQILSLTPPTAAQPHPLPALGGTHTIWAYPCQWGTCSDVFEDNVDLGLHLTRTDHIKPEKDGYYCYWMGCPRTKENNGKPFDVLQKIIRHVKEVHMLRIVAQKISIDKLGCNYFRRGVFLKDTPLTETVPSPQQILQQATLVMPTPPTPSSSLLGGQGGVSLTTQDPTTPISSTVAPSSLTPLTSTPSKASMQPVPPIVPHGEHITDTSSMATQTGVTPPTYNENATPPNVFISPPNNTRQVCHSQIYMDYIKRLRNNEATISPLGDQPIRATPLQPTINPNQWIDRRTIPEGMTPIDALYKLRDHLMSDALKIDKVLSTL